MVVRVRRESDNNERDFNEDTINSGDMVRWVNQQITPPLDLRELTATGRDGPIIDAAAAYSLRNLSDSYTGNVVEVRRSSDDTTRSFTAAEVANGTLTDWVNVGKNYVGYARFQDSTTANVNLTSSFTLEPTNNWSIKFGYIGGSTPAGLFGLSGNGNTGFWLGNLTLAGITDDSGFFSGLSFGGGVELKIGQHQEVEFFNTPAEGVRVKIDGVTMSGSPKIYGDITIDRVGLSRGRDSERVIENVRIDLNGDGTLDYSYAGDGNQASNWTDRVGSNNGTPTAQVLTYNNEYKAGYVETWYDQSGNGNNATQLTASQQPKIVNGSALVAGGIDFLTSQYFDANISVTRSHLFSVFRSPDVVTSSSAVHLIDNTTTFQTVNFSLQTPSQYKRFLGGAFTQDVVSMNIDGTDNLVSALNQTAVQGGSSLHINGSPMTIAATDTDSSMVINRIGKALWANTLNQVMAELIIYDSDQSANRAAIEANINNKYDIY
jgi:hypothetical protein